MNGSKAKHASKEYMLAINVNLSWSNNDVVYEPDRIFLWEPIAAKFFSAHFQVLLGPTMIFIILYYIYGHLLKRKSTRPNAVFKNRLYVIISSSQPLQFAGMK